MDFVTHLPLTSRRHNTVWVIVDQPTKSANFPSCADDLHIGGILPVVYPRDCSATCACIHSVGQRPEIYSVLLEEFPKGYRGTTDHEYNLPPTDRWSVREDHSGVRGHAASMRPRS